MAANRNCSNMTEGRQMQQSADVIQYWHHLAADAGGFLLGEGHQGSDLGGDDRLGESVVAPQQRRLGLSLAQDRLEDPQQRLRKHVGQVILGVDGNVVLQNVNGILEQRKHHLS